MDKDRECTGDGDGIIDLGESYVIRKKYIIDILVIGFALILFIYWYEKKFETTQTMAMSNYKIYLITMDKEDQFWYIMNQGALDMASMLGVTYIWDAPQERIVREQIDVFNRAVEVGADAIMLAASDPREISRAVEDAKANGVKMIYVDAPANEEGIITLATDNYNAGKIAGETMLSELMELGIRAGSIGIIGVTPENITTLDRERGFRDAISQNEQFTVLDTRFSNGDPQLSQEFAETYIEENPGLVGLFGTNEGSTVGVGNAIAAQNNNIVGIGFDLTKETQKLINKDALNAIMVQNPYTMGYLGMASAVAAVKGFNTGPPFIDTGVSILTKYQPIRPLVNYESPIDMMNQTN